MTARYTNVESESQPHADDNHDGSSFALSFENGGRGLANGDDGNDVGIEDLAVAGDMPHTAAAAASLASPRQTVVARADCVAAVDTRVLKRKLHALRAMTVEIEAYLNTLLLRQIEQARSKAAASEGGGNAVEGGEVEEEVEEEEAVDDSPADIMLGRRVPQRRSLQHQQQPPPMSSHRRHQLQRAPPLQPPPPIQHRQRQRIRPRRQRQSGKIPAENESIDNNNTVAAADDDGQAYLIETAPAKNEDIDDSFGISARQLAEGSN